MIQFGSHLSKPHKDDLDLLSNCTFSLSLHFDIIPLPFLVFTIFVFTLISGPCQFMFLFFHLFRVSLHEPARMMILSSSSYDFCG